jgi:hypothetical protein
MGAAATVIAKIIGRVICSAVAVVIASKSLVARVRSVLWLEGGFKRILAAAAAAVAVVRPM